MIPGTDAKRKCEQMGGHLVTITSREEDKAVIRAVESVIGANLLGTNFKKYFLGAHLENDE